MVEEDVGQSAFEMAVRKQWFSAVDMIYEAD